MKYHSIEKGTFLERPNRFIAYVEVAGQKETVHVKNTGRCKELLTDRASVYLERSKSTSRRTAYDLVAVEKNGRLINMDSQAPNRAVEEWLLGGALFPDLSFLRPETVYASSRFDFYAEAGERKIFLEVKGVTLETDGVVQFPDAPSERAVKHVEELKKAVAEGYEGYILFVIQMEDVRFFTPNYATHPRFGEALLEASKAGVQVLAYDCIVKPEGMTIHAPVKVILEDYFGKNSSGLQEKLRKGSLKDIPKPLLKWYDTNRRVLPWREEPTPYRVWVSEIMLQQTRVEAVKPYFERFMAAFPDIESLAEASEEQLLKLWEGLGYYNRVRNLQKAARQILSEYGGQMPSEYEELLKLSGIGSYTAGAIASIACGKRVPAVDGNVLRVVSRLCRREEDIAGQDVKKQVERELLEILPERAGDFNQAMMELGAMVCIPNGMPHCEACPLQEICLAKADGVVSEYPKKSGKKPRSIEEKTVLVIRDGNRTALCKRPSKGLLAGMYEFPSMEGHKSDEEVREWLKEQGLKVLRILPLAPSRHIFTHKEWDMWAYMVRVDELEPIQPKSACEGWLFAKAGETEEKYPIPSAFAAYTEYLDIKLGNEKYRRREET